MSIISEQFNDLTHLEFLSNCRLFCVAFSLAFKMISEIDMQSVNRNLAHDLLGLTMPHFNAMESAIFARLKFDVGISEEEFKSRV